MGLDAMIFVLRILSFKPAYGENVKIGGETSGVPPLRYTLISSSQLHQVAKVLELQLQYHSSTEYSGLIYIGIDWFDLLAVQGTLKTSPRSQFKSTNSSVLSFLYGSTLTSIRDYWKNHSFD